ncbi:MAG: glutamine cyclotransferase [Bacteroidetes bacterium]|nr:glutamine cyclotransferase [Bacteroidota bacterium]
MKKLSLIFLAVSVIVFASCKDKKQKEAEKDFNYASVEIPAFNADSAFAYVKNQCDFGPRVPESKAHKACGDYLVSFFKQYADTVIEQNFTSKLYNGKEVKGRNIIVSFNLASTDRALFSAHWDSRAWADNDADEKNHKTPIIGANDGASGVGVLMEIARCLKAKPTSVGVDIVLFDVEDQGCPEWDKTDIEDQSDWCLGSQYWAKNLHIPFYQAKYGILLDMVGYSNPLFVKESQSMYYAPSIMNKVWQIAKDKGYGNMFSDEQIGGVMDDHIWVNKDAKIPMIDIVQHDPTGSFFPYWHTVKDDITCISKNTLKAVGDVCLVAIYSAS